ncbi:MAG TPA: transposase [Candidatus Cybelea sp.]
MIERVAQERYPQTALVAQVAGVGPVTSLAFVLTIGSADRFGRSRDVGAYLGLVPRQYDSGDQHSQLPITKAGNKYLRRLLVQSAQYVLGPFGPDCRLRSYGQRLMERGGKNAKKRAIVAAARKLAVLLHHLWAIGAHYDTFHGSATTLAA